MSAVVAPLERSEVFWFVGTSSLRCHAFELVEGEIEPLSVCGHVSIDDCADEPSRDSKERQGWNCQWCLSGVL